MSIGKDRHGLRRAWMCLALAVGGACSSSQRPPPATCDLPQNVNLVLRGSDRLNLDDNGRSLPVVVRIYQLKNIVRMEDAEFEAIWRHEHDTLTDDVVHVDEVYVYPNQRLARAFRRDPKATHVVAVAIFRHPAGTSWRTIYELPPAPGDQRCAAQSANPGANPPPASNPRFVFFLEDYRIEATGEDPGPQGDAGLPRGLSLPDLPNAPQLPSAPTTPTTPGAPQVPGASDLPTAPQTPGASDLPSAPQTPGASDLPSAPTAPSGPTAPGASRDPGRDSPTAERPA